LGGKKFISGIARDDKELKRVVMKVSGPKGSDIQAFSEMIDGVAHDLSNYAFDSNNSTYAGLKGSYSVELEVIDDVDQTTTQTFSINVI
jgi:phytoene/squalene synthetase